MGSKAYKEDKEKEEEERGRKRIFIQFNKYRISITILLNKKVDIYL